MPLPKELPANFSAQVDDRRVFRNRYVLDKRLGTGNFGTAYLVYDKEEKEDADNRKVMKQICVGTLDPGETVDAMKEAHLLSRLQHINIVQFYESFLDGQFFCIITELCDGGDLDVKLREYKNLEKTVEEVQVVTWLEQLLKALEYMHDERILHRDLKAKNIFLKDNQMKIGDFGISRILMGTSDKASTFVGTPYYMSPEVLQHERYDEKCDMWSLGCVLYEMCCLKHAFEGQSLMAVMYKIVTGDIPELPKLYSQALNIVLSQLLARDHVLRHTAREILSHNIFKASTSSEKSNPTPRERLRFRKQKAADEKFRSHRELAAQKRRENERRHRESVTRNFHHTSVEEALQDKQSKSPRDSMVEKAKNSNKNNAMSSSLKDNNTDASQDQGAGGDFNFRHDNPSIPKSKTFHPSNVTPRSVRPSATLPSGGIRGLDDFDLEEATLQGTSVDVPFDHESTIELAKSLAKDGYIPEDALLADTFYTLQEDFEVDSSDLDLESDYDSDLPEDHINLSDTEYKELLGFMADALELDESTVVHARPTNASGEIAEVQHSEPTSAFANKVIDGRIANMKGQCLDAMGQDLFNRAYSFMRSIWPNHHMPISPDYTALAMQKLQEIVHDDSKCFLLEQLVYLENEKQIH